MPQRFKSLLIALLLTATLPLLSGCNMVLFEPKGAIAAEQIRLIIIATILMLLIVVPVIVMTIVIAWRYRASNAKATYEPNWAHSVKLEIIWWGVPCIIVAILATLTWFTTHSLDPYKPLDSKVKPITIQVIALDWKWVFVYPEQGIATINYIEIPENTPISFEITAQGPMNSFWIPQLGGQIYAMAGMRTRLHLIADTQGVYDGLSANYSGEGFAEMTFKVKVETSSDFAKWVETVKASPDALTTNVFNALIAPSSNIPVQYFSSVQPNLFNDEMMKFMMPPMTQMAHSDETTLAVE